MRFLLSLLFVCFVAPAAAQSDPCRGRTVVDVGNGGKACIYLIDGADLTWTTSRDDGARDRKRTSVQPRVAANLLGEGDPDKSVLKEQFIRLCNVALSDVQTQFADAKFSSIMLYMDRRHSGGEVFGGISNAKCRGFRYFKGRRPA